MWGVRLVRVVCAWAGAGHHADDVRHHRRAGLQNPSFVTNYSEQEVNARHQRRASLGPRAARLSPAEGAQEGVPVPLPQVEELRLRDAQLPRRRSLRGRLRALCLRPRLPRLRRGPLRRGARRRARRGGGERRLSIPLEVVCQEDLVSLQSRVISGNPV